MYELDDAGLLTQPIVPAFTQPIVSSDAQNMLALSALLSGGVGADRSDLWQY